MIGLLPCPRYVYTIGKQAAYQFPPNSSLRSSRWPIYRTRRFPLLAFRRVLWYHPFMKLYLLSCQNIQAHAQRILLRLPGQRRLAYTRSHSALTLGAGLLLSSLLNVHQDEDVIFGPHGKPFLATGKPHLSLSHSKDHVLLGISDLPIGVDMEFKERIVSQAARDKFCLPKEKPLDPLQVFTRKECAMKLTGLGFSLPMQSIDTTSVYKWQGREYRFFTVEQEGYVISILTAEGALPAIQLLTPEELL